MEQIQITDNKKDPVQWESLSIMLHRLLTLQRHYDASKDPRLLIFEAQQFINFKPLEGGLEQMELLEALLKDPRAVVLAPTGSGKTAVISQNRSLLKPNGKNLVIQKVLPALYQQTYDKMRDVLGDLFGVAIYPFKYNLKMRSTRIEYIKGVNSEGNRPSVLYEVSNFKYIYYEMLETIKHHGTILTDYKSLPMLEEKFWKLGQELRDKKINGRGF